MPCPESPSPCIPTCAGRPVHRLVGLAQRCAGNTSVALQAELSERDARVAKYQAAAEQAQRAASHHLDECARLTAQLSDLRESITESAQRARDATAASMEEALAPAPAPMAVPAAAPAPVAEPAPAREDTHVRVVAESERSCLLVTLAESEEAFGALLAAHDSALSAVREAEVRVRTLEARQVGSSSASASAAEAAEAMVAQLRKELTDVQQSLRQAGRQVDEVHAALEQAQQKEGRAVAQRNEMEVARGEASRELEQAKASLERYASGEEGGPAMAKAVARAQQERREVARLSRANEQLQQALRDAFARGTAATRRGDSMVRKIEMLEHRCSRAEETLESMEGQLRQTGEAMEQALNEKAVELERVSSDAEARVQAMQAQRKRDRTTLVSSALSSLSHLRSHLSQTLAAMRVEHATHPPSEDAAGALERRLGEALGVQERFRDVWAVDPDRGTDASGTMVRLLPPVSVKTRLAPSTLASASAGQLPVLVQTEGAGSGACATLPRVNSMPSNMRTGPGKALPGTAAPYDWPGVKLAWKVKAGVTSEVRGLRPRERDV